MRRIIVRRYQGEEAVEREDWVAEEGLLELSLAGGWRRRFAITPERIREFVYGHLLSEGLIRGVDDVLSYRERLDPARGSPGEVIRVEVSVRDTPAPQDPAELIWTPCGGGAAAGESQLAPLSPRPLIAPQVLFELPELAARAAEEFRLTGAYHYTFLFGPAPTLLAEIALKALRAGVPLIVSKGAALLGAIALARRYNLGLVGFLRGRRFNLYAGEGWLT